MGELTFGQQLTFPSRATAYRIRVDLVVVTICSPVGRVCVGKERSLSLRELLRAGVKCREGELSG
jgi:hypothetical protein